MSKLDEVYPGPLRAWAYLLVLCGLSIAQPAFEVIAKTPEFFPVRRASPPEIIVLTAVVLIGPPSVGLACEAIAGLAGRRVRAAVHLLLIAALVAVLAVDILEEVTVRIAARFGPAGSPWLDVAGAGVLGAAAAWAYVRWRAPRLWLSVLLPAPLIFGGLFLLDSPVGGADLPDAPRAGRANPVVMVVFDEFPITSVEDARGGLDGRRYPNLARFAAGATWYRNATTVSDSTPLAVPSLLTGNRPHASLGPTASSQPGNLFTLLRASHRMDVTEIFTQLCPADLCPGQGAEDDDRGGLPRLVRDTLDVAVHAAVPAELEEDLRPVNYGAVLEVDANAPWNRFIERLGHGREPAVHFLHVLLPHHPWTRLPSGRRYVEKLDPRALPPGWRNDRWTTDAAVVRQGWQRHLLQVRYVDRMVGRLMRRLEETGLYDRALVVLVADHGVSFRPGHPPRLVDEANVSDIAGVPLFVKAPGQRQGRVEDSHVQTIDVLPTIARELRLRLPQPVDGRPLGSPADGSDSAVILLGARGPRISIPFAIYERRRAGVLGRQTRLIKTTQEAVGGTPVERYIARRAEVQVARRRGFWPVRAAIDTPGLDTIDPRSGYVPALMEGRVLTRPEPPTGALAVALNGRLVAAVVPAPDKAGGFVALLPEEELRPGRNRVELYEFAPPGQE